jgi:hypothetical protein
VTVQDGQDRRESGMVSAELAVALVSLLLVLALFLGALRAGMDRAAAVSAAGALAREASRGGDTSTLWAELSGGLPTGSTMALAESGALVRAVVRVPVSGGFARVVLPEAVEAEAVAARERP